MEKRELQLQPRLACIAGLVPEGARLADIGTDHGYLPVWLLQQGMIGHAIASDINALPLDHARATALECGVMERMDFHLCPGLEKIKAEECDTIAIAGMGGETIIGILSAAPWTRDGAHTLILQPQTKTELLRRWLCANGYRFLKERLVRDKEQLYVVFLAAGGQEHPLSAAEAITGFLLDGDPLYGEYLAAHIAKLRRAAEGIAISTRTDKDARITQLRGLIAELEEKEREWKHGHRT